MAIVPSGQVGEGLTERDRQREDTRRRVREIALDIIRRDGLAAARVDEMARLASVSRGTVYFHYPTKEHVVAELLGEVEERIAAALRDLPAAAPIDRVLEAFCEAFAREWEKEARLFPSVASVALRVGGEASRPKELDAVRRALGARFRVACERGELTDAMRPSVLANAFLMNVLTATFAWSTRPRPKLATVLGDVPRIFLHGAGR
jgi:AcrR family transcriptional regulator